MTAVYDGKVAKVLKGRSHNGRPQLWTIAVCYWLADGSCCKLTVRPKVPAHLTDLSHLIADAIRADRAECGEVLKITWTAMSR